MSDTLDKSDPEKDTGTSSPTVEVLPSDDGSKTNLWTYVKANRRSFGWSIYLLMNMVGYGFDGLLTGSLVGIPAFQKQFGYWDPTANQYIISALWQSLWTAMTSVMAMVGALVAGQLIARFGLRIALSASAFFAVAGIIFEQLSRTPAHFLGAKIIAGIGYGLQTALCIMTIPAFAPTRLRGPLGACLNTFILFGGWLAQGTLTGTGTSFIDSARSYEIPFGLQYIFVAIIVAGIPFVPNPVDWHLRRCDLEGARNALTRLHGPFRQNIIDFELRAAELAYELEKTTSNGRTSVSAWEPLRRTNIKRTVISAGVLGFQQLVGATFVTSYLTYFFQVAGTPVRLSLALGEMSFTVQVLGNLVSWFAIEKLGRRMCLVGGLASMTVVLIIIGITWAVRTTASLWVMVGFMTLWAFLYQGSIGAVGYSVAAESPSPRLRPATIAISQAVGQLCAWAMGFATPYMINPDEANLAGYVGFVFAGLCGLATVWAFFSVPETAGRSLVEIEEMWCDKVPVRQWKQHVCRVSEFDDGAQE